MHSTFSLLYVVPDVDITLIENGHFYSVHHDTVLLIPFKQQVAKGHLWCTFATHEASYEICASKPTS